VNFPKSTQNYVTNRKKLWQHFSKIEDTISLNASLTLYIKIDFDNI
jgi:hypothetical protein